MSERVQTAYAHSGRVSIAYQTAGEGVPVVWVPGFISHVEMNWDIPPFGHALERVVRFARIVVFDKRGTGLSDRSVNFGSIEERMDDIRAVMDAVGLERASVFAISEGGPLSILFAATYPERVDKLVLYGTFARLS
jgi:pimeloyl-ACP methyl ester carboxylesterase